MDNVLEAISEISEFNELSDFLNDEDLDETLGLVIKLIAKPNVDPPAAKLLIVKLQALSAKYGILAVTYTTILRDKAGTPNNHKKNIYYSLSETLNKLTDAVKYSARII